MKRLFIIGALILAALGSAGAQTIQETQTARDATRERLRQLLASAGPKRGINVNFRLSDQQPYNFVGVMRDGLSNAESMEIVIGITSNDTIGFRIYPHYKGGYINLDKAKNGVGLMRLLLNLSDKNFLFWGADATNDVFAGYTFTLESGFPDRAIEVVLYSITPLDKFVGQMRPFIDGSAAP